MNSQDLSSTLCLPAPVALPAVDRTTPGARSNSSTVLPLTDRASFASIREEWNDLLESTPARFPCQTWEYLDCAWDRFASERLHPRILTVRDEQGQLAGGMPVMVGLPADFPLGYFRHLSFFGCHLGHQGESADLLARPGKEDPVALSVARFLAMDCRSEWDVMAWSSVSADSLIFPQFCQALKFHGIDLVRHELETAPYIGLRDCPGVVEPVSPKLRRNLRSTLRKIKDRLDVRVGGRDQTTREALEQTLRLHNLRWGYDPSGGNPHDAFHLQLADRLEPTGQNFSLTLNLDGELAAGTYGYIKNRTFYGILIGWNPKFRHLSMGHVLLDATLREMKNREVDLFEFLGGGGDYKTRWTHQSRGFVRFLGTNPHSLRARGYSLLRKSHDWLKKRRSTHQDDTGESIAA